MGKCVECGRKLIDSDKVCPYCGNPIDCDDSRMDDAINGIKKRNEKRKLLIKIGVLIVIISFVIMAIIVVVYVKQEEKRRMESEQRIYMELHEMLQQTVDDYNKETDAIIQDVQDAQQKLEEEQQNK